MAKADAGGMGGMSGGGDPTGGMGASGMGGLGGGAAEQQAIGGTTGFGQNGMVGTAPTNDFMKFMQALGQMKSQNSQVTGMPRWNPDTQSFDDPKG